MASEVAEIALMNDRFTPSEGSPEKSGAALDTVIERAKEGDSTAFEQIITCYQHKVVSTAWRILGNQEDARDAAQEVFLRVFKYLSRFKRGEDFSGWLYMIIVNACRDIARRRGRRSRFLSFEVERDSRDLKALASGDDVEAEAILLQEKAIVMRALDTLSKKEREAIVLRDLEGLPTEEVARILGSSQTTVRSQISSARTKIKLYRDRLLNKKR